MLGAVCPHVCNVFGSEHLSLRIHHVSRCLSQRYGPEAKDPSIKILHPKSGNVCRVSFSTNKYSEKVCKLGQQNFCFALVLGCSINDQNI